MNIDPAAAADPMLEIRGGFQELESKIKLT